MNRKHGELDLGPGHFHYFVCFLTESKEISFNSVQDQPRGLVDSVSDY
jgi:hypothetical protein